MADTQHTPGPWDVYYDDDGVEIRAGVDGGDVMGMFIHGEEMDANARLIASAPALLEALEYALADLEGIMPEYEPSGDREHPGWQTIEDIKAAIAKAKGGSR
jgi:hypothetical protein